MFNEVLTDFLFDLILELEQFWVMELRFLEQVSCSSFRKFYNSKFYIKNGKKIERLATPKNGILNPSIKVMEAGHSIFQSILLTWT